MPVVLTDVQRADLETAASPEQEVRRWQRYRAVLRHGEGMTLAAVAAALRCSGASVYGWTARWRRGGVAGLREGDYGGGKAKLDAAGEARLVALLASDLQAQNPLHRTWFLAERVSRPERATPGAPGVATSSPRS
jgi:transposase